jgi:hypothetical protein
MEEILNRTIYARCQRRFEVCALPFDDFISKHILFFQELKETILSTTSANSIYSLIDDFHYFVFISVEIDSSIPALKCELLPESTSEEILFISISPFSGLYKIVSYMGKITKFYFSI